MHTAIDRIVKFKDIGPVSKIMDTDGVSYFYNVQYGVELDGIEQTLTFHVNDEQLGALPLIHTVALIYYVPFGAKSVAPTIINPFYRA